MSRSEQTGRSSLLSMGRISAGNQRPSSVPSREMLSSPRCHRREAKARGAEASRKLEALLKFPLTAELCV